jgi:hypothetical protein
MRTETTACKGIVKGSTVILEEGAALPEDRSTRDPIAGLARLTASKVANGEFSILTTTLRSIAKDYLW